MYWDDPKKNVDGDTVGVLIKDPGGKLKDELRQALRDRKIVLLRKVRKKDLFDSTSMQA